MIYINSLYDQYSSNIFIYYIKIAYFRNNINSYSPSIVCADLISCQQCTRYPFFPCLFQDLLFHVILIRAILTCARWCLMTLISFPWWLVMLKTFSCTCWLFVCLLWKSYLIESYAYIKVGFFPTELNEFLIYSGY